MLSDYEVTKKNDLIIQKTKQVIIASMQSLLNECRFAKLTVSMICEKAEIGRATFYAHFIDKYDLLEFWLLSFWKYKVSASDTCEYAEGPINQFISENKKIIKNLLLDADDRTLDIVYKFLCSALGIETIKDIDGKITQKNIVAGHLYIGGIVNYLLWQAKHNFPPDVPVINDYSFGAFKKLWDWFKVN